MASLYIHVPFCTKKCLYCDFYSIENSTRMEDFIEGLLREFPLYSELARHERFETIFLGGGTPSLLSPDQLQKILDGVHSSFSVISSAEVTLETNPGTVDKAKLSAFKSIGINRLSIGVQSFDDEELKFLSRIHSADEAKNTIKLARSVGFTNMSLDFIYALPGQTLERWSKTLSDGVELEPEHISAYGLIVEEGTPLIRMVRSGRITPAFSEDEAALFEHTMEFLTRHGYEHYEVSNYGKPGFRSRHNYNYWQHVNYLGFGPSAHSFWKDEGGAGRHRRWGNIANIAIYIDRLKTGQAPIGFTETLSETEYLNERIFLSLRSDGLNLDRFRNDFGFNFCESKQSIVDGLISEELAKIEHGNLMLTSSGYLICDEIAERLNILPVS